MDDVTTVKEEKKDKKNVPEELLNEDTSTVTSNADDSNESLLKENNELRAMIENLQNKVEEEKNAKLRFAADCQNIRARAEKEKEELLKFAQNALLAKLLDFTNDFKNIIDSETFVASKDNPWFRGVASVYDKLHEIVQSEGVSVIEAEEGMPFNPQHHEAIGFITVTEESENQKIAKVASLGYKRNDSDKVVLPARVIVNRKN